MNNAQNQTSDSYHEYHIKELQDLNYAAIYLETHIEDHEPLDVETNLLKLALSNVAEAIAPEQLIANTEILEMILQKQGAEAIYDLADWLKGLGLKLTVVVDQEAEIQNSGANHTEIETQETLAVAA